MQRVCVCLMKPENFHTHAGMLLAGALRPPASASCRQKLIEKGHHIKHTDGGRVYSFI